MGAEDGPLPELAQVERVHYKVEAELARGGMGRILQARDRRHGRPVAIKELLADTPALRARFRREALITARLQHPAIVPVYEAGKWPSGEPFYAMKLVDGRGLDQCIAERRTLELRLSLLHNVIAVAEAIAFAHERQVIHRDLKPANVLVGGFGETVVIDWGLAKELGEAEPIAPIVSEPSEPPAVASATIEVDVNEVPTGMPQVAGGLTVAGRALGTPAYMAPEQARGEPLDPRADVYALGSILYHLLAGSMPYADSKASTGPDLLRHVINVPPTPLLELEPKVPRDLAAIVDRAMARDPAQRYANAKELAEDLRRFETGQLVSVRQYTAAELFRRWLRRNRVVVAFASALIILAAVGGAISVTRIVRERDRAEEAQVVAETAQAVAEHERAAAEAALTAQQRAEAGQQEAMIEAATAKGTATEAMTKAATSEQLAAATGGALLALWLETKGTFRLQECYLAHYVRGATRLPTIAHLEVSATGRLKAFALASTPAKLSACVDKALKGLEVPPMTKPGLYSVPVDMDLQTAEPRIGMWVSEGDWLKEVIRRRYSDTLTRCYQARVIEGLAEPRTSTPTFTVQGSGRVALASNKIKPAGDPALARCLQDEVATWLVPPLVDAAGKPTSASIALNDMPREAPPPGSEVCPFGHSLFDVDGTLVADRRLHGCTAFGRYDARDGRRNLLGWHSHDPATGNAR